ncbi:MAG: hypothetical protein WCD59_09935, partial [Pseudolabrys sp.]
MRAADSNAVLAAQAFQNNPDLLLDRIVRARNPGMFYTRKSGRVGHVNRILTVVVASQRVVRYRGTSTQSSG